MTCKRIGKAIVCSFVDKVVNLAPYGAKVWMEWHRYMGPVFFRSEACIQEIRVPSKKTWDAFKKWQAESKQNK